MLTCKLDKAAWTCSVRQVLGLMMSPQGESWGDREHVKQQDHDDGCQLPNIIVSSTEYHSFQLRLSKLALYASRRLSSLSKACRGAPYAKRGDWAAQTLFCTRERKLRTVARGCPLAPRQPSPLRPARRTSCKDPL